MRKFTWKETAAFILQMIIGLILAALFLAEWMMIGLFVYTWYFG